MAKAPKMTLMLGGNPVEVTHELAPIEQISLNTDNPRIRFQIKHRKGGQTLSPAQLVELVREQPGYDALQKAIRKAGGLSDPVIVRHDGLVVEGNTRATVFKVLNAGNSADPRWQRIPIARLPKHVPEHAMAMLMASYHIAGKTVWRPYAQADQIYNLRHTHKRSIAQIADETRMSEREVEQYLSAYEYLLHEVLPHVVNGNGSDILESKFSHALEFIKRKNLADIREDPVVRKQLARLLIDDKIKGAEVRELDKVLKNQRASKALKNGGFKAAKEVLTKTDPVAASKILREMKALTELMGKMGHPDINLLKSSTKAQRVLIELNQAVLSVAAFASVKLGGRNG